MRCITEGHGELRRTAEKVEKRGEMQGNAECRGWLQRADEDEGDAEQDEVVEVVEYCGEWW